MKAVVLEIKNGEAAVLAEDGSFRRVRQSCKVGDTIELADSVIPVSSKKASSAKLVSILRRTAAAAAAVVIIGGSIGTYQYTTVQAASYVTLDGEVSFEYVLNRRGQVIAIHGLDEKGLEIEKQIRDDGFSRCTLPEALEKTREMGEKLADGSADSAPDEGDSLLFSVTTDDEKQRAHLTEELKDWIHEHAAEHPDEERPEIMEGSLDDRKSAMEEGKTTGRYLKDRAPSSEEMQPGETAFSSAEAQPKGAAAASEADGAAKQGSGAETEKQGRQATAAVAGNKAQGSRAETEMQKKQAGAAGAAGEREQAGAAGAADEQKQAGAAGAAGEREQAEALDTASEKYAPQGDGANAGAPAGSAMTERSDPGQADGAAGGPGGGGPGGEGPGGGGPGMP